MPELIYDEWYGEVTRAQRAAYRKHNIAPADHRELADYFGENNHTAITVYVKAKGRLNFGDVYRDRPDRQTGKIPR